MANTNGQYKYDVCIVGGLGHIGLPLGIYFADKGLNVLLNDINAANAERVRNGELPFIEYDAEPVLKRVLAARTLHISLDPESVREAATVIVAIGTPVDEYLNPKTEHFLDFFHGLVGRLTPAQPIIIRSSIYPGMAEELFRQIGGAPWQLAYAPERIVQGYAMKELPTLPQIVSGMTPEAENAAAELFGRIAPKIIRTTVLEAELVKLMANAWRYIKFSVANQFYMICEQHGVDYARVRHAMRDGYERALDVPGPGFAAGPCLLKDTMQLASFTGNQFQMGHAAMLINEGLPNFLVGQLQQTTNLHGKKVGILGMAFKADIDDVRDSLSFKLAKVLRFAGAEVLMTDEYIPDDRFLPLAEVVAQSEVLFVSVPHKAYRGLKIPVGKEVVDLWGVVEPA